MTATSIYETGTSPQCSADCWWCLGIDAAEFEKYRISIDTNPRCKKISKFRSHIEEDPGIAEKRKLVQMRKTMFTSICSVEGHLNLDILNEWMNVGDILDEWTQKYNATGEMFYF